MSNIKLSIVIKRKDSNSYLYAYNEELHETYFTGNLNNGKIFHTFTLVLKFIGKYNLSHNCEIVQRFIKQ